MKNFSIPAIACAMTLGFGLASAQTITPTRVGPVSQYGQLMSGKNSAGEGRIYGSCQGVKDGAEVQVRGMSLYWSLLSNATDFWNETAITTMVNDMNIQIIRAAMATGTEDWSGPYKGYASDPTSQKNLVSAVVEAAIKNDIYVIIDWHSHSATEQTSSAQGFFSEMAQKYGSYDNVIFEVFNEPQDIAWSNIKNYADQVISTIRQYSDNLILVGNRSWDQHPEEAIGNEVTDSGNNHAYTLHYYANSHCVSGSYDWGGSCEGANGLQAMKAGLSIFLSEWGTGNADGSGTPDVSRNTEWQTYANTYKLSWANWSASKISEGTAAFTDGATASSLQYSTSGSLVKSYLATNPTSYTKCSTSTTGGETGGQTGGETGGETGGQTGGETGGQTGGEVIGIAGVHAPASLSVAFSGKTLEVSGATTANVELFDITGNKLMKVDGVTGSLSLATLPQGHYLVKVSSGSMSKVQAITLK